MLDALKDAIDLVPKHYYELHNPRRKNGQIIDYTRKVVYPERNYCTNLYHHLHDKLHNIISKTGEDFYLDEEI